MAEVEEQILSYKKHLERYLEREGEHVKILHCLKKLKRLPVTLEHLQKTKVGKVVNGFRKHEGTVSAKAKELVNLWKTLVPASPAEQDSSDAEEATYYGNSDVEVTSTSSPHGEQSEELAAAVDTPVATNDSSSPASQAEIDRGSPHRRERSGKHSDGHSANHAEVRHDRSKHDDEQSRHDRSREDRKHKSRDRGDKSQDHGAKPRDRGDKSCDGRNKSHDRERKSHDRDNKSGRSHDRTEKSHDRGDKSHGERHKSHGERERRSNELENSKSGEKHKRHKEGAGKSRSHENSHSKSGSGSKSDKNSLKGSSPTSSQSDGDTSKHEKAHCDKKRLEGGTHITDVSKTTEPEGGPKASSDKSISLAQKIEEFKAQLGVEIDLFADNSSNDSMKNHSSHRTAQSKETKVSHSSRSHNAQDPKTIDSKNSINHVRESSHSGDEGSNAMSFADALNFSETVKVPKKSKSKPATSSQSHKSSHSETQTGSKSGSKHSHSKSHSSKDSKSHSHSSSKRSHSSSHSSSHSRSKAEKSDHHKTKDRSKGKERSKSRETSKGESRKRKGDELPVPLPTKEVKLSMGDIMNTLPEITPNYKPLPANRPGFTSPSRHEVIDDAQIAAKKHGRSQVYAGRKQRFLTSVPRLYDACLAVLKDNLDALEYVGGVPYSILKPVLERCSPQQLYNIEEYNPTFIEEDDELWEKHSSREFKGIEPEEFETYRELYLRKLDEREAKLKKLTANISSNISASKPVRQTKLAYVDTLAKAPRGVRKQQQRYGTAGPVHRKHDPLAKLSSHRTESKASGSGSSTSASNPSPAARPVSSLLPPPEPVGRKRQTKSGKAPMMLKTMKMMKNLRR